MTRTERMKERNDIRAEELYSQIKEEFLSLDDNTLMEINNDYCDKNSYYEDKVYSMYEIDDLYGELTPSETLEKFGEIYDMDYFKDGIYVEGANYVIDLVEDFIDDLIEFVIDEDNPYHVADELIDEYVELIG